MDFTSDKQKRAADIDYQMIKAIRNKRRRIYSSSDDDNNDNDKVNKTAKYQKTQSGISIQNPQIPTSVFYSKESTNKIKINTSPVKPLVTDNIKEDISSKIEAFMTKKSPKTNHKKINRRLNTNEPKLGNKGVKHCIRRPKHIKIIAGKLVKLSKKSNINRNKLIVKKLNNNNNESTIKYNDENQKPTNKKKSVVNIDTYYTDTDSDSEDDEFDAANDELLQNEHTPEEEIEQDSNTLGKRKFFKSTVKPIRNEFQVMKNLKMTVFKGKLLVLKEKRLKQKRKHPSKKRISKIIQELSRIPEKPSSPSKDIVEELATHSPKTSIENINQNSYDSDHITVLTDDSVYAEFHNRLPYNTNDPQIIEQQHLLLDFLITHNICNEENFKIFIADPDNHKEKAAEVVNSLAVVVPYSDENLPIEGTEINESIILPEDYQSELINSSNNTSEILCRESKSQSQSPAANEDKTDQIEDDEVSKANNDNLKSSEENVESQVDREETSISDENAQKKLFPVFYPDNFKNKYIETETIKRRRNSLKGTGLNQYQIDAGQKEFGAKQCAQCGLLYTVHEPEEEKLHNEYHQSLEVFQFKGWNDEIIAQKCPEWSPDGRIIIITNLSNTKRKQRLMDILRIVDNQLGFASYIFPSEFTAYLAIKRNQIIGICLTQPLQKANKYICQNGIDCCSEEFYDVKCGISRIWISPLHRRIGIASKLISTVQLYTIPGEIINLDQIAFSAPTEDGKAFARKITKKDDFLVYQ